MNRQVKYKSTLLYYDEPLVVLCEDKLEGLYIGLLVNDETYFCVPISPRRLDQLYKGDIDLLDVFRNLEEPEYYSCVFEVYNDYSNELRIIQIESIPHDWFPDEGLFLPEPSPDEDIVLSKSRQENKPILYVALNPPEAITGHKIHVGRLSDFLSIFQNLVKYLFKQCSNSYSSDDAFLLNVTGFQPGSFTVQLESLENGDLLGGNEIANCLRMLDEFTTRMATPQSALKFIQQYKGHLAGSYIKFLEYIQKNDSNFKYTWATPEFEKSVQHEVKSEMISSLLDLFSQSSDIANEDIELIGSVKKADSNLNTWKIFNEEDNKEYAGKIKSDSSVTVSGLVIDSKRYKFYCEETISSILGSGRAKKVLYLVKYEELG